jgi:hypothetical protein
VTVGEPLENLYFNWLCAKVVDATETSPNLTYWELLKVLQTTEFVWVMSGDDNRCADGRELRMEFILQADVPDDEMWRTQPGCSVLEMCIAFARRAEFSTEQSMEDWFWEFMFNLGLHDFCDGARREPQDVVDILEVFIWRRYDAYGVGSMFPNPEPSVDLTTLDIWYQFNEYLTSQDRLV